MKNFKILFLFTLIFCVCIVSGCGTFNQAYYDDSFASLMNSAKNNLNAGEYPQAIILSRSLLDAEPENAEARAIIEKALKKRPELSTLFKKGWLGS
ncbi:MAG: hypothetical protein DRH24_18255, partial [Deltaproteobacteria bacterium]